MSRITVSTGTRTKKADSITDELLSGDAAMIERGKSVLYHEMIDRTSTDIELAIVPSLPKPSDIISISEDAINSQYVGACQSFNLSISKDSYAIKIGLEVPIL